MYRKNIYLLIALPVLLFSVVWELMSVQRFEPQHEADKIYKVFETKERQVDKYLSSTIDKIFNSSDTVNIWNLLAPKEYHDDGTSICVIKNGSLVFWSSSLIAFPQVVSRQNNLTGVVHLPTGWYYVHSILAGEYAVKGFILLKREFPYKNKYIQNAFLKDFDLPDDYIIKDKSKDGAINITKPNGEYLFSVESVTGTSIPKHADLTIILYFLLIFLILAQVTLWLRQNNNLRPAIKFLLCAGIAALFYLILNRLRIPQSFYQSELFAPGEFAYGGFLSSLGEYVLLSLLMFYVSQTFFSLFESEFQVKKNTDVISVFAFLFAGLYFSFSVFLFKLLLLNSNISLEFFSNLKLSLTNVCAFFCVSLHALGFVMIVIRLRAEYCEFLGLKKFIIGLLGAGILSQLIFMISGLGIPWSPYIYYTIIVVLIALTTPDRIRIYKFSFLLIVSIICATYLNLYAHELSSIQKNRVQKLLAVNLSSERDPAAEIFLSDFDNKFKNDILIQQFLFQPYKSIEPYFRSNYFTGFWRNYDLQITVCSSPKDTLFVRNENKIYPCFEFFNELQSHFGVLIPGSTFYFLNWLTGPISYLGELDVVNFRTNEPLKIFIMLSSKIVPEGNGYPELLLDEHTSRESREEGFSYSKYFDGQLVDRGGDYQYEMRLPKEAKGNEEFTYFTRNKFLHCAYHRGENNYIIVSYPKSGFIDQINTFPYLFLLVYLIGMVIYLINRRSFKASRKRLDFRGKIQLTLILSLLGTLTLVGFSLIAYNYNEFKSSLQEDLNEKLRSISTELSMRMGAEERLNPRIHDMLTDQLISLSDITRTDINLYNPDGQLFATSRSEIYDRGLTSRRMDPSAFRALSVDFKTQFLHNESLGKMTFFSAYIPEYNQSNDLIGYLNLPYFTRQDEFKKEVSAFIVAFSNVYILLILISLLIALFIGNKLTLPLLQIEKNLKGIQLGKENAKIEYLGEDEIGRLAKEYNKKVDELAESAALLARSERELAWREMARQVAHEINNPLTPMKLNIQYLQRIKEQGIENFDEYFEKVSKTLIENIDVLSMIASSFSDFAKMPKIHNELLDLQERARDAVQLFEKTTNVTIHLILNENEPVQIVADKDQFNRALINLIKNGIQAIPREKEGNLVIEVKKDKDHALISVTDDGVGIPAELHEKLFEPSFTTKSSGMGLGLAITKRIIENFKGEIWFQTEINVGTSFFIKVPLARNY